MDLARKILLAMEKDEECTGPGWVNGLDLGGEPPDPARLVYHVMLLAEAGLIIARDMTNTSGMAWMPVRLTWEGHEFLDKARDEGIWRKAVELAKEKTGGVCSVEKV
jgi:hypothetical protein